MMMKEIRTEIDINASVAKVWEIISNLDDWATWNKMVTGASGKITQGATLSITMRGKSEGAEHSYAPTVIECDAPKYFRFRASMGNRLMMTNYKICQLEDNNNGGTKFTHIEQFSGLMVPFIWKKMEQGVPMMLAMMNKNLKQQAET
ncbi:MAG: SRPBCC domain-containing protein [Alphaproteobacteria bacterium]|nr:SRPBCC domain-containing protein [Alphaproteobacteria bacterium]